MVYHQGMYIRFDPNKLVLPPILGGPLPNPDSSLRKRQHELASTLHFPDFEKVLQRASENELNYAAKSLGGSSGEGPPRKRAKVYSVPTPKDQIKSFESRAELIQALQNAFRESQEVNFAGVYRLFEPGVTHQQRVKTLTHEIWEVTGYRFTIKDHPRMKGGFKTRLWCSQDEAHKLKPSKTSHRPRTLNDGALMAKLRYPCRSGLLISSRDNGEGEGGFTITLRMHHHVAHEPYRDSTVSPENSRAVWPNKYRETEPHFQSHVQVSTSTAGHSRVQSMDFVPSQVPSLPVADHGCERRDPSLASEVHSVTLPQITEEEYQRRMRQYIDSIRNFCDGLEYQLPLNDFRMLEVLERESASFLKLVAQCSKKDVLRAVELAEGGDVSHEGPSSSCKCTGYPWCERVGLS